MKREIPPGCVPIHPAVKADVNQAVLDLYIGIAGVVTEDTIEYAREVAIALLASSGLNDESKDYFDHEITETVQTLLMIAFMREPRLLSHLATSMW